MGETAIFLSEFWTSYKRMGYWQAEHCPAFPGVLNCCAAAALTRLLPDEVKEPLLDTSSHQSHSACGGLVWEILEQQLLFTNVFSPLSVYKAVKPKQCVTTVPGMGLWLILCVLASQFSVLASFLLLSHSQSLRSPPLPFTLLSSLPFPSLTSSTYELPSASLWDVVYGSPFPPK